MTLRHEWARGHLRVLLVLAAGAFGGLLWSAAGLAAEIVRIGLGLALLTGFYFLIFRFSGLHARLPKILPGKELFIAICFTAGIALAVTEGRPWEVPPLLLTGMGLLFAGNCLLISRVEAARDCHDDPAAYYSASVGRVRLPEMLLLAALCVGIVSGYSGDSEVGVLALVLISFATLVLSRTLKEATGRFFQALADGIHLITWLLPGAFDGLRGFFVG